MIHCERPGRVPTPDPPGRGGSRRGPGTAPSESGASWESSGLEPGTPVWRSWSVGRAAARDVLEALAPVVVVHDGDDGAAVVAAGGEEGGAEAVRGLIAVAQGLGAPAQAGGVE